MHQMPPDFRATLASAPKARAVWEDITPLARNEWICWIISGKKQETRGIRIRKAVSKLSGGMRRPCCWAGCMHRSDTAASPSRKRVHSKVSKRKK